MISIRPVVDDADVDTYIAVRNRVHPQTPIPRAEVLHMREDPGKGNLDLIAESDGAPVGAASVAKHGAAPDGELAYMTIRVMREHRRRGVGTALYRACSVQARALEKTKVLVAARHDDTDSLAYYPARGFDEVGRVQDVFLDLASVEVNVNRVTGIEIVPATAEHDLGAYEVALEADADIPAAVPITTGTFERWRENRWGKLALRDLSFVALGGDRVVGFAILGRHTDDIAEHWMTGVARDARGRGIALALKQAQIAAAKDAGWAFLRTQNDLGNAPMRRVNEKLGYERRFEWVHLVGPLLA